MKSKQIIVSGKVQGVGFRNFTRHAAIGLGVVGWARNLANSDVEIFAQSGDEIAMRAFIERVRKGPSGSKIENIEIIDVDSECATCDTFEIAHDGEKKSVF